eukprot:scaffold111411_cov99-Phaeocystis_antarctica.AAC.2
MARYGPAKTGVSAMPCVRSQQARKTAAGKRHTATRWCLHVHGQTQRTRRNEAGVRSQMLASEEPGSSKGVVQPQASSRLRSSWSPAAPLPTTVDMQGCSIVRLRYFSSESSRKRPRARPRLTFMTLPSSNASYLPRYASAAARGSSAWRSFIPR